ncbi:MAG TPA: hypothetical protein VIT92_04515, partial [Burkholderiaceae bacterium]
LAGLLQPGDVLIAHPAWWSALLQAVPHLPRGVTGVTSTAPCPDALSQGLQAAGLDRLLQIYGSSETAGVGWRSGPAQLFRLLPYWARQADGALRRVLADGVEVVVQCQDQLEWNGADTFLPAGRLDAAVQVAGINVFPARVASVLAAHPGVAGCAVRLMRADEGARLKAFVVPSDGATDGAALQTQLGELAARELTAAERPAAYTFGTTLPRTASGKPADWIIDAV